jgi:hypothetical protein
MRRLAITLLSSTMLLACTQQVRDEASGRQDGALTRLPDDGAGDAGSGTVGSGVSPDSETGSDGDTVDGDAPPNPSGFDGMAITRAQVDAVVDLDFGGSSSSSSGGPSLDPETLYLKVSNAGLACGAPYDSSCGQTTISVGVPPELVFVGSTVELDQPGVIATASELGPDDGSGECAGGGGGGGFSGTLEILRIEDGEVEVRLTDVDVWFDFDPNGQHLLYRCP